MCDKSVLRGVLLRGLKSSFWGLVGFVFRVGVVVVSLWWVYVCFRFFFYVWVGFRFFVSGWG